MRAPRDLLPRGGAGLTIVDMNFARLVTAPVLLAATLATAQADSSARVVETHPSASATLARNQSFWVRIEYQTDEPIRLWARPFRNGAPVETAMSNTSSAYTGAGEALGWFALTQSGDVDEVRVVASGEQPYREWLLARYPVELHWTAGSVASDSRPQWVEDLLALDKQRRDEAARQRAAEPVS